MIREPRVSVIVPTHNRAALLPRAIESLLAQSRRPDEIIVVDDGSTDDTEAVAAGFGDSIRYIRQPENGGISRTRNVGMRAATGDYLAFLDSDDTYFPLKLEVQVAFMEDHPRLAMVSSDFTGCHPDGTTDERHLRTYHETYRKLDWSFADVYPEQGEFRCAGMTIPCHTGRVFEKLVQGPIIATNTILIRRDVPEAVGYQDERLRWGEDFEFVARICKRFPIGYLDVPTYGLYYHDGQISRFMNNTVFGEREDMRRRIEGWANLLQTVKRLAYEDRDFHAANRVMVERRLAGLHWQIALMRLMAGDSREAREHLRAAHAFDGRIVRYLQGLALSFTPHPLRRVVLRGRV